MNYQRHYGLLIERARVRVLDGYTEEHHILPKCLGGKDNKENLVYLTAEEHFVAHQLLVKIHPKSSKIAYAAIMMTVGAHHEYRVGNKPYGWIKRRVAIAKSNDFAGKTWTDAQNKARSDCVKAQWADPEFRAARSKSMTGRKWSAESRAARSEKMKGQAPLSIMNSRRMKSAEKQMRISTDLK